MFILWRVNNRQIEAKLWGELVADAESLGQIDPQQATSRTSQASLHVDTGLVL